MKKVLADERLVHIETGAALLPGEMTIRQNGETGEILFVARCCHPKCDTSFLSMSRPPGMSAQEIFEIMGRAMRDHDARVAVKTGLSENRVQLPGG